MTSIPSSHGFFIMPAAPRLGRMPAEIHGFSIGSADRSLVRYLTRPSWGKLFRQATAVRAPRPPATTAKHPVPAVCPAGPAEAPGNRKPLLTAMPLFADPYFARRRQIFPRLARTVVP